MQEKTALVSEYSLCRLYMDLFVKDGRS